MGDLAGNVMCDVCFANAVENKRSDLTAQIAVDCAQCASRESPLRRAVVWEVSVSVLKKRDAVESMFWDQWSRPPRIRARNSVLTRKLTEPEYD